MRTEETSCTVLHRLIQEQLRYGNPTDTHTLLAIQQQALRNGGNKGTGSPRSSSGSLSQEERQEPQGQEYHNDYQRCEFYHLHPHHNEALPTYEQAKASSQFLASQWYQKDSRQSHGRSLSDHTERLSGSSSCSYPQIADYRSKQQMQQNHQGGVQEFESLYSRPPPLFYSQNNRILPHVQNPEAPHIYCSSPPVGREVSVHMELLMKENERLRQELEGHTEKASRIQKLEKEMARISEAYETLMQSCVKRESLEQTFRSKLTSEIKRLQDINAGLRESLECSSKQVERETETAENNKHIITKLLLQREEQQLKCTGLERELQLLFEENLELQAELQKKNTYIQHVERLQGALAQLQATCQKRESLELRLRTRLEQELRIIRHQQRQTQRSSTDVVSSSCLLQERLREREEQILALEADMTRWHQKYLEEKTMREFAMEAAATAAAQRDTNIINHLPCHSSKNSFSEKQPQSGTQEVDDRIRALYRQVMEKDAVINVLQQGLRHRQEKGEAEKGSSTADSSPSDTISFQNTENRHTDVQAPSKSHFSHTPKRESSTESRLDAVKQKPVDSFEGLDDVKPEALEIFI